MAQSRPTTRNHARVELRWSANRASNVRRAVVEDVSDIDGVDTGERCPGDTAAAHEEELGSGLASDLDADNSGRESYLEGAAIDQNAEPSSRRLRNKQRCMSTQDLSADGGKQKTTEELVHHGKTSRSLEPLGSKEVPGVVTANQGHSYQEVVVSDHAQMHAGDMYNLFHVTLQGPGFATDGARRKRPTHAQEAVKVCLGTWAVLLAFLGTLEQLFLFVQFSIQRSMVEPSLPEQIALDTATFEDALGDKIVIDLKFIGDWDRFQYLLHHSFLGREGCQRVANFGYRLFRQARSDQLFHPKSLPPFSSVFSPGQDVRMSLHFGWNEVSDKQCPRCGLESNHDSTSEILCARCNFLYRSQVRDISNAATSSDPNGLQQNTVEEKPSHGPPRDIPGHFHRISISARDDLRLDTRPSAAVSASDELLLQPQDPGSPLSTPSSSPRNINDRVAQWIESMALPSTTPEVLKPRSFEFEDVGRGNASEHRPRSTWST